MLVPMVQSRLSLLVDLASLLSREVDLDDLLAAACQRTALALGAERATIWLVDAERGDLVSRVALLAGAEQLRLPLDRGIAGYVARTGQAVLVSDAGCDPRFESSVDRTTGYTTRSMLTVPVRERASEPVRGVLQVLDARPGIFQTEDEQYLSALAQQLARALAMTTLRAARADAPGLTLRGPFNHIVGRSQAMQKAYGLLQRAAPTDANVLLRGETGTGKGLLARALHVNSRRQTGPFVTVDCTTLPRELVESELFGHERGAFTGAARTVPGRVELAAGGTLFLDEIGELSLEAQAKLLRFVQERRFERVGGRETLEVDVRLVVATHRDLDAEIAKGHFREDLLYRLRVVEIDVPPLRARGDEEVELLARHFLEVYAGRHGQPPRPLKPQVLAKLCAHRWPGNVRELEHWAESAVILSSADAIDLPAPVTPKEDPSTPRAPTTVEALEEAIRLHCEAVLAACDGNRSQAAARLRIGRNRLARLLAR
jgi:Nif-specific regulatory protein